MEKPKTVRVLEPVDVWLHAGAMCGTLGALATGPLLQSPALSDAFGASARAVSWAHGLFGAAAALAWLLHALRVCLAWLGGRSPWGLVPRPADLAELGRALAWGAFLSEEAPRWGRFSYRERFSYAVFFLALPALTLTGWLIGNPESAVAAFGTAGLLAVASAHAAIGALLVLALLWHVYFALLQPGALFWNGAWLTGSVPWSVVERTRPGWAATLTQPVEPAKEEVEAPSVEALLGAGNLAAREGRYDEAEDAYLRALALYPGYSQALFNLGVARSRKGDRAGAREALSRFLEQDPFNPVAPKAREILKDLEEEQRHG